MTLLLLRLPVAKLSLTQERNARFQCCHQKTTYRIAWRFIVFSDPRKFGFGVSDVDFSEDIFNISIRQTQSLAFGICEGDFRHLEECSIRFLSNPAPKMTSIISAG